MGLRLEGKVALITGAGGGIGLVTAQLFCQEGAGVALVGRRDNVRDAVEHIRREAPGARALPVIADIAREVDATRAISETIGEFGHLDILVNNAAVREIYTVAEAPAEAWSRVHSVNVVGMALCCKAALPALRQRRGASIVNVSSTYGAVGRKGGWAIYDTTKAAEIAFTRDLAAEEAPQVRVNVVCPGSTLTPFTLGRASARGMSEDELLERGAAPSLLGRWAEPMEVAYPILWFASDESSFITGASLMVDGGLSAV